VRLEPLAQPPRVSVPPSDPAAGDRVVLAVVQGALSFLAVPVQPPAPAVSVQSPAPAAPAQFPAAVVAGQEERKDSGGATVATPLAPIEWVRECVAAAKRIVEGFHLLWSWLGVFLVKIPSQGPEAGTEPSNADACPEPVAQPGVPSAAEEEIAGGAEPQQASALVVGLLAAAGLMTGCPSAQQRGSRRLRRGKRTSDC
jgi:hypothetical protein